MVSGGSDQAQLTSEQHISQLQASAKARPAPAQAGVMSLTTIDTHSSPGPLPPPITILKFAQARKGSELMLLHTTAFVQLD